ncbi:MAG: dephospho-CoA kinase [Pseudomonadota bacterium]|nr:dephospho-CoA kinase [Pseudomonadota bacterium]
MAHFIIGLTGGIAAGKSAADAAFKTLGVPVIDADLIARELVEPGQAALAEIANRFGPAMLDADGRLDRAALRRHVFADDASRRELEAILHPRIRAEMARQGRQAPHPYAIASIPLLAEGGGRSAYPWLSRILLIDVSREIQQQRLIQRDGIDAELAQRMIAAQANRSERQAIADDILQNEATLQELGTRIAALDRLYRCLADNGKQPAETQNR